MVSPGCSACVVGMVSMVMISSLVSVVFFLALGLLAELVVLLIARLLCFAFDLVWFRGALLFLCFLSDCVFAGVSSALLLLDPRDPSDFAVFALFPILVFGSVFSRCSSS